MFVSKSIFKIVISTALIVSSATSVAAPISIIGTNFDLIYDNTLSGLFGTPTLTNDSIFFTPVNFKAESLNGNGVVTANSTINLQIIEKASRNITGFSLLERGDYRLIGNSSVVGVGGQTRVFDLSNPFIDATNPITSTSNFSIVNTIFDSTTHNWTSNSNISVLGSQWNNTSAYNYTIENLLTAYTDPTASGPKLAFIEKKFAGSSISIVVTTVPEAESYAMMLSGLVAMGFVSRRRNKK